MKLELGPIKIDTTTKPKRNIKKKKSPMEFSKKILVVAWLSGSLIILFACWLTYQMVMYGHDGDVQLIAIILTGGFAEITAGTSFYYWKSKNENVKKIDNAYPTYPGEEEEV